MFCRLLLKAGSKLPIKTSNYEVFDRLFFSETDG